MCAIFGLIRNQSAPNPERATAALIDLGRLAVSRGSDSAGLAFIPPQVSGSRVPLRKDAQRSEEVATHEGIVIKKSVGTFNEMWDDATLTPLAAASGVVIGHTRAATQGRTSDLANVSPMPVGTLIGTHNGDIAKSSVSRWVRGGVVGGTDTEHLYRAIDSVSSHRKKITEILEAAEGRIALAWLDRRLPNRVYLARGGLSPLTIAFDRAGNLYWASGSSWFRQIDEKYDGAFGFEQVFMVPEGSLITVDTATGKPVISDMRTFTPTVRSSDKAPFRDSITWRGVDPEDAEKDRAMSRHRVAKTVSTFKPALTTMPGAVPTTYSRTEYKPSTRPSAALSFSDSPDSMFDEWDRMETVEGYTDDEDFEDFEDFAESIYPESEIESKSTLLALENCTNDEIDAAFEAASRFIKEHDDPDAPRTVNALSNFVEALRSDKFGTVITDYGLSSEDEARAFIEIIFDHDLYESRVFT